jgi:hypothetical protein
LQRECYKHGGKNSQGPARDIHRFFRGHGVLRTHQKLEIDHTSASNEDRAYSHDRLVFTIGAGFATATTSFHSANHIPILSGRFPFQGLGIDSEHFDQIRDLAEMPQRIAQVFVVAAQQVHKKNVFPGPSAHGARLDLT